MKTTSLAKQLRTVVDLRIPGFMDAVPPGSVGQTTFRERSSEEWFQEFSDKCINSINKQYFPVLRMSDGEFYFCTGIRAPAPAQGVTLLWHKLRFFLGCIRMQRYPWRFRSGAPNYGWEEYSFSEWSLYRKKFAGQLREIAKDGALAINFSVTEPPFAEQYVKPFCNWLDDNSISVTESNYYPFYFVYALLNGPSRRGFLKDRNILVVISHDELKKKNITRGLEDEGALSVSFIQISRSKSMGEAIDISSITNPVDVVLIGAGVGSVNILSQLKSLNTLCIDAGFCLEVIADGRKRKDRVFCVQDVKS